MPTATSYTQKRLKLDSLMFYHSNLTNGKTYSFEYDRPESIPNINSYGQDLIGLNNGASNSNLVPGIIYGGVATSNGANRNFNFNTMTIGTLTKMIYPTKGYSTFSYEQNKISDNTLNPSYTYSAPQYLTMNKVDFNNNNFCEEIDLNLGVEYFSSNPSMNFISPLNYPNHSYYQYSDSYSIAGVRTSLLRINDSTNVYIETEGEGVYLIQKIENCSINNDINTNCFSDEISISFNSCLRATNSLYYNGLTSSHPNDFITGGLTSSPQSQTPLYLPAGTYQITLWAYYIPNNSEYSNNMIKLYKMESITVPDSWTYNTKTIEGFRVKEIKDYSSINVLATTKEYRYTQDLINDNCSGVQLGFAAEPKIYTTVNNACVSYGSGCRTMPTIVMSSSGISTMPNMGYESVFEIVKNGVQTNGYSQSKFKVGVTGIIYPEGGGLTSFEPFFENGKILEKNIFDKLKNIRNSEIYTYLETEFHRSSSFSFAKNSENTYAKAGQNGNYALNFEYGVCSGNMPGPADAPPGWFQGGGWYSGELGKYSYHLVGQDIVGKYGYLSSKQSITYPESGGEIVQTENYTYDESEPFRLVSKDISVSNNILKSEQYTYHPDYPENPEKITDILSYSNGELISSKNNVYANYGTANLVNEIKIAKGSNPLESRIVYDYDPLTKNIINSYIPVGTSPTNDSYDSYIYGYNDMYPVAKLTGVKFSQIATTRITAIKAKTNVVCTIANENALITELNLLRTDFPNAQITTYTYNPVFGITSETDAKGDIKYFTYDELGRLLRVKDRNGNILSENQYHYKY